MDIPARSFNFKVMCQGDAIYARRGSLGATAAQAPSEARLTRRGMENDICMCVVCRK